MENPHGVILFLSALVVITVLNNIALKKLKRKGILSDFPFVSILVPARDEEKNIHACVKSLLEQDYPAFEVIVHNDSTDKTGEILKKLSGEYPSLKVIEAEPLPVDWVGKQWACHRLYRRAEGEFLLFVDADTRHHRDMLRASVERMIEEDADLLTIFPYEETITFGEKLIVPFMHWSMITIFPMFLLRKFQVPQLVIAVGQFMFFRRKAYDKIDGHRGVKDRPVDDVAIARNIVGGGHKMVVADGTDYVKCRMFDSFKDAHAGFARSLFGAMGYRVVPFLFMWTWILIVFWQPIVLMIMAWFDADIYSRYMGLSLTAVFMSLVLFFITFKRFGFSLISVFLYPAIVLLTYSAALRSLYNTLSGKSVWKGRTVLRPVIRYF